MAQLFFQLARQKTQAMPKHRRGFLTQRAGKRASQKSQILGWRTIFYFAASRLQKWL